MSLKSVSATQNDVEDIEDLLAVMESTVVELKGNPGSDMELQCLMYKYAHLEMSILESLEFNTQQSMTPQGQKMLNDFIERYTELGPDYQAKWTERLWNAYGVATKGYNPNDSMSRETPSLRDLGEKLHHVQGLAKTLTHLNNSPGSRREDSPKPKPPPRAQLQPVIQAAVRAHERQKALGSKRGLTEGCCHRCGIY